MGVIDLYSKIKDIVGKGWRGTPISEFERRFPTPAFTLQPVSTDGASVTIRMNIIGYGYRLFKKDGEKWVQAASYNATTQNSANVSLTAITETTLCRIEVYPFLGDTQYPTISNEFTVTRTAAQASAMKMDAQAITEDITVEKEDITPVPEKVTTTTKSK